MFNLGAGEMLVVLVVALLAFGPDKLPEAARRGGQVMTDLRSWSTAARRELAKAMEVPDEEPTFALRSMTATTTTPPAVAGPTSLIAHLVELRRRLLISLAAIAVGGAIAWMLYPVILDALVDPYCRVNGGDCGLFVTDPLEGFSVRLKVAGYGGVALAMPVVLWQIWQFVAPGLYAREKRYAVPFVASGMALFVLGAGLAYWTLPRALEFLIAVGGDNLIEIFAPGKYLSLVTFMMIAFGIGFQFPLIVTAAQLVGLVTNQKLRSLRRYVMVGIVAVVAVVTPSADPYSLLALAVPMYVSYEIALVIGRLARR